MSKRIFTGEPIDATMRHIGEAPYHADGETVDVVDREAEETGRETVENLDPEAAIRALRQREADADETPGFIPAVERAIAQFAAEATVEDAGRLGYLLCQYRRLVTETPAATTPGEQRSLADYADGTEGDR